LPVKPLLSQSSDPLGPEFLVTSAVAPLASGLIFAFALATVAKNAASAMAYCLETIMGGEKAQEAGGNRRDLRRTVVND
jgi:hypothetical protein